MQRRKPRLSNILRVLLQKILDKPVFSSLEASFRGSVLMDFENPSLHSTFLRPNAFLLIVCWGRCSDTFAHYKQRKSFNCKQKAPFVREKNSKENNCVSREAQLWCATPKHGRSKCGRIQKNSQERKRKHPEECKWAHKRRVQQSAPVWNLQRTRLGNSQCMEETSNCKQTCICSSCGAWHSQTDSGKGIAEITRRWFGGLIVHCTYQGYPELIFELIGQCLSGGESSSENAKGDSQRERGKNDLKRRVPSPCHVSNWHCDLEMVHLQCPKRVVFKHLTLQE